MRAKQHGVSYWPGLVPCRETDGAVVDDRGPVAEGHLETISTGQQIMTVFVIMISSLSRCGKDGKDSFVAKTNRSEDSRWKDNRHAIQDRWREDMAEHYAQAKSVFVYNNANTVSALVTTLILPPVVLPSPQFTQVLATDIELLVASDILVFAYFRTPCCLSLLFCISTCTLCMQGSKAGEIL